MDQLKYLIALQTTNSINKASKMFYTTPQNISKAIKQLENEWNVALIDCTQQGTVLTKAGEAAAQMAQGFLESIDQFLARYGEPSSGKETTQNLSGHITIISARMSGLVFLGDLILKFNTKYPQIKITLQEHDSSVVFERVTNCATCIGLTPCFLPPHSSRDFEKYQNSCEIIPLLDDEMVALVSSKSVLAQQKNVSFQTLVKHPLANYTHGEATQSFGIQFIERYLADDIHFKIANTTIFYNGIAQGNYVGLSSMKSYARLEESLHQAIHALPIREPSHFSHCLVLNKQRAPDKCTQYFNKFLQEFVARY